METKYVKILEDCVGFSSDQFNEIKGTIELYEGEIYEEIYVYNYYRKPDNHWNTTHPVIGIYHEEDKHFLLYELHPESYEYIEDPGHTYAIAPEEIFERSSYYKKEDIAKEVIKSYIRNCDLKSLLLW
jgi:hypothetical protein